MQHRGSSDSRATADSHCAAQGSRDEMEMSWQRSSRDVLLIWLVKLQERVKRVDTFVRDRLKLSTFLSRIDREALSELVAELRLDSTLAGNLRQLLGYQTVGPGR